MGTAAFPSPQWNGKPKNKYMDVLSLNHYLFFSFFPLINSFQCKVIKGGHFFLIGLILSFILFPSSSRYINYVRRNHFAI